MVLIVVKDIEKKMFKVRIVKDKRIKKIGRKKIEEVVISIGIVELRLIEGNKRIENIESEFRELKSVIEDGRVMLEREDRIKGRYLRIMEGEERNRNIEDEIE